MPTAEQLWESEEREEVVSEKNLDQASEEEGQAPEQSAQDALTTQSDERSPENAKAADKTLAVSDEPTEQHPPKERTPEERREELRDYLFRIIDGDLTEEEKAELGDEFTKGFGEGFVDELNEILGYLQVAAELPRVSMDKTVADAAAKADALLWLTNRFVLDEESRKQNISITAYPIPGFLKRHIEGARERNQQDLQAISQFLGNALEETHKIVETLRSSPKFNRQASDILQALGQDNIARSYFNSAFSQQTTLANRGQSMEKTPKISST